MLVIRVISFKGQPVRGDQVAEFGEAGGTIGRGRNSTLVLQDPELFISRTHAIVSFQAGGYIITDNGTTNPVILNGQPLGAGAQARLADGNAIQIGSYLLRVSLSAPVASPAPAPRMAPSNPKDDPLALIPSAHKQPDPFADLEPAKVRAQPPPSIPHDQDPLAGLHRREPSIDDLLDRDKPARASAAGPLPPAWPIGQHEAGPGVVDPLDVLLGIVKPVPRPTMADHGPEVATPYVPPVARPEPSIEPPASPPAPASALHSGFGAPPAPADSEGGATAAVLFRAFLNGAGLPELPPLKSLTPELMEMMGQLLREAVQGTLDLLRARGVIKSEIRADVTMIMSVENNPLKFSPTVEAALAHLLAPGVPGFLSPVRAMKEAHDDLRAHHLGFLAGMRAALDDVLVRFTPSELQQRLSDPSVLDTLLPMNRKAKLWDLFVERYEDVAGEARENFNAAFGKAFLRAYEAQVRELRAASAHRR
jgi:FHA domain-containing protein